MGTISSGVGLISGLDIESLVSQLMAIEQRPRDLLTNRIELLTTQQTALMSLQARVMALQLTAANFNQESIFQQKAVSSTDESVLTVTANQFAAEGTYKFIVKRLASSHHLVSRGYSSLESSLGTGTVSFEIGNGQLARPTELSFINGQNGFQR
jgi:flagellar hook-associated protein 2